MWRFWLVSLGFDLPIILRLLFFLDLLAGWDHFLWFFVYIRLLLGLLNNLLQFYRIYFSHLCIVLDKFFFLAGFCRWILLTDVNRCLLLVLSVLCHLLIWFLIVFRFLARFKRYTMLNLHNLLHTQVFNFISWRLDCGNEPYQEPKRL